jgi:PTS system nitrogen regulatory IIA component
MRAVLGTQDLLEPNEKRWFAKESIMKISDYLDPSCIVFLNSETRDDALNELVDVLYACGKIPEKESFFASVIDREDLVSTGIGMQVAIPHAKKEGYKDFFIAVGVQKEKGIEWQSLDKAPVRLVFMIGGPENKQTQYLKILSRLTQVIKDEKIRKKLITVGSKEEFMKVFDKF